MSDVITQLHEIEQRVPRNIVEAARDADPIMVAKGLLNITDVLDAGPFKQGLQVAAVLIAKQSDMLTRIARDTLGV